MCYSCLPFIGFCIYVFCLMAINYCLFAAYSLMLFVFPYCSVGAVFYVKKKIIIIKDHSQKTEWHYPLFCFIVFLSVEKKKKKKKKKRPFAKDRMALPLFLFYCYLILISVIV